MEQILLKISKQLADMFAIMTAKAEWLVDYKSESITSSGYVKSEGATSISLRNIGDDNAVIDNEIPCNVGDDDVLFINEPGSVITKNFQIRFTGTGVLPKILVIKTYYHKVKK